MLSVNECMVDKPHDEHDWWYTSTGGGHQLDHDDPTEKNTKRHHCPGKDRWTVQRVPADETPRHNRGISQLQGLSYVWLVTTSGGDHAAFRTWEAAYSSALSMTGPIGQRWKTASVLEQVGWPDLVER